MNILEKNMSLIYFVFPKLWTPNRYLYKCMKSLVSEDPSTSSIVTIPKHFWDLCHSAFIIFLDHCQVNWVEKSLSYWHAKSWVCLLTHWLPMKCILFLIEIIYRYQFRYNCAGTKKPFLNFWLHFWNLN